MSDLTTLAIGILIGFAVAIPVGPLALLVMRRTLERGTLRGFATGLGAAVADLVYASAAAFGVAAISSFLAHYQTTLRLVGGTFLLVLAVRTVTRRDVLAPPRRRQISASRIVGALASGFLLAFTNPLTAIGFAAIFASFGVGNDLGGPEAAVALVSGVFAGSAAWWAALSVGVARIRHLVTDRTLRIVNQIAAGVLAVSGLYALFTVMVGHGGGH